MIVYCMIHLVGGQGLQHPKFFFLAASQTFPFFSQYWVDGVIVRVVVVDTGLVEVVVLAVDRAMLAVVVVVDIVMIEEVSRVVQMADVQFQVLFLLLLLLLFLLLMLLPLLLILLLLVLLFMLLLLL